RDEGELPVSHGKTPRRNRTPGQEERFESAHCFGVWRIGVAALGPSHGPTRQELDLTSTPCRRQEADSADDLSIAELSPRLGGENARHLSAHEFVNEESLAHR